MEKVKTFLKDKGIGYFVAIASVLLAFIALLVYLITVRESYNPYLKDEDFTPAVVICLSLASALGLVLLAVPLVVCILGLDKNAIVKEAMRIALVLAPVIIFGLVAIAFFCSLSPVYGVFIRNATGLQGLEPITYSGIHVSLIFCLVALLVSAVGAGFSTLKGNKKGNTQQVSSEVAQVEASEVSEAE